MTFEFRSRIIKMADRRKHIHGRRLTNVAIYNTPEKKVLLFAGHSLQSMQDKDNEAVGRKEALNDAVSLLPKYIKKKVWEEVKKTDYGLISA